MSQYLDPKADVVFKKVFADHPHLLKSFLNAVLPLPAEAQIESLSCLPAEQIPDIPLFKRTIVDVKCQDTQGRFFIVEMQMEWVNGFMQRMLFNAGRAYINQLNKGEDYTSLYPVYALGIVNSIFDPSEDWYHHYKIVNIENTQKQLEGLEFVFLELPKFKAITRVEKKLRILWLRFLSELNEQTQTVSADLLAVPEIQEACDLSKESAYSKEELEAYWKYWDQVSTERTLVTGARAEGKAEGEHLAKIMIAKNLLNLGLDLETVSKSTNVSQEELSNIR